MAARAASAMPDQPLRILQVVATAVGGDWFYDQVTGLGQLGHTVQVVLPGSGPLADRLQASGIEVAIIPFKGKRLYQQLRVTGAELQLLRFIRAFQPDVIHAHLFKAVLSCRLAALGYRRPLRVAQLPGMAHVHSRLYRLLDQRTLSRDDLIIGCCQAITDWYRDMGARSVATNYYGFDVRALDPLTPRSAFRREFGLTDDTPAVGMLAYMYPSRLRSYREIGIKGHEVFLDAAPLLVEQVPDVQIFVIGDEITETRRYRHSLEARAAALGLGQNVRFIGHRTDVASVLAGLDVVVNPSLSEGASHVIAEALLMRKGVVATDVGGTPDIVLHGQTGLLVQPGDPVDLANAAAELFANPTLREEMGSRGRDHCLRLFDINTTIPELETLYREALGHKRRRKAT